MTCVYRRFQGDFFGLGEYLRGEGYRGEFFHGGTSHGGRLSMEVAQDFLALFKNKHEKFFSAESEKQH